MPASNDIPLYRRGKYKKRGQPAEKETKFQNGAVTQADLNKSRKAKLDAETQKLWLENEAKRGALINMEGFDTTMAEIVLGIRNRLLGVAASATSNLVDVLGLDYEQGVKMFREIDRLIREALTDLSRLKDSESVREVIRARDRKMKAFANLQRRILAEDKAKETE
jgi:hypothetical protein